MDILVNAIHEINILHPDWIIKTALITNDIIKAWNITEKDLYEASQKYIEDNTIIKTLNNVLSKLLPDVNVNYFNLKKLKLASIQ